MFFNSLNFLVFISIFFVLYFSVQKLPRLLLCLIASYFFYGCWDWRFLTLIAISTCIDFYVGKQISYTEDKIIRKRLLLVSIVANLGFLAFFKYFNFFIDSFKDMLVAGGIDTNMDTLSIILPMGISFYTFQSMSYTIDIYRKQLKPEENLLVFATYISFFPQLVAGPIVRACDFLPQFTMDKKFNWDRIIRGSGQVLWGFFKKVAIADSLALYVDLCFGAPSTYGSLHLIIGVVFYAFQIYCDFSGYSDIAIGLAKMMGFDFPRNFRTPYFSKNFSEFWERWHISLSSWLRDYLYIPLGGNRSSSFGSYFFIILFFSITLFITQLWWLLVPATIVASILFWFKSRGQKQEAKTYTYLNLMVTMLLGGLWHGAAWTFLFWGFLHGTYLIIQRIFSKPYNSFLSALRVPLIIQNLMAIGIVFFATCFAWIFFRASSFDDAFTVIKSIGSLADFSWSAVLHKLVVIKCTFLILILVTVETFAQKYDFEKWLIQYPVFRVASFAMILWIIAFFGTFGSNAFIYFQF